MLPTARPSLNSAAIWPRPGRISLRTNLLSFVNCPPGSIRLRMAATVVSLAGDSMRNLMDSGSARAANRNQTERKDSPENKHRPPAEVLDQRNADDPAKDGAESRSAPRDGDESCALSRRRIFGNQRHDVWNGAAQPDAAKKAKQGELLDGCGIGRGDIEDAKPHNRDGQGLLAAQFVGGISEQKCAEHCAQQHRREHRAELARREFPFGDDAWRNIRNRLRVEAVTHDNQNRNNKNNDLEAANSAIVDDDRDVDRGVTAHFFPRPVSPYVRLFAPVDRQISSQ